MYVSNRGRRAIDLSADTVQQPRPRQHVIILLNLTKVCGNARNSHVNEQLE